MFVALGDDFHEQWTGESVTDTHLASHLDGITGPHCIDGVHTIVSSFLEAI